MPNALSSVSAALANRCPRCGGGRLLTGFLDPAPACSSCGADLEAHAAGDGAVFIVLTLLCFLVIAVALLVEGAFRPALWVHAIVGLVATVVGVVALLPLAKRFMIAQSLAMDAGGSAAGPDPEPRAFDDPDRREPPG